MVNMKIFTVVTNLTLKAEQQKTKQLTEVTPCKIYNNADIRLIGYLHYFFIKRCRGTVGAGIKKIDLEENDYAYY